MHFDWKRLVPFVVLLALATPLLAQGPRFEWRQGGLIRDAFFLSPTEGWTAEDGGRIRFWDGSTWQLALTPDDVRQQIQDIFFLDDGENGWAVGYDGTILKSVDGGQNWDRVNSTPILDRNDPPGPARLNTIFMFDNQVGWVGGDDGAVWYTQNAWSSWGLPFGCTLPEALGGAGPFSDPEDVYQIEFLDAQTGFMVADYGHAYRSINAGCQWQQVDVNGVACDPTDNGHPNIELWDFDFSGDDGWIVGGVGTNDGFVFRSDDRGASWTQAPCFRFEPALPDCTPVTLYGTTVHGAWPGAVSVGYRMVALQYETGVANLNSCACTPHGPGTCPASQVWVQKSGLDPNAPQPPLFGAESLGPNEDVVVTGLFGVLRHYDPAAGTIAFQDHGTVDYERLHGGAFTAAGTGCVIGQGGRIKRTTDSGATWTLVYSPPALDWGKFGQDVAFSTSGQKGVAVGDSGFVVWSADGGQSWAPPVVGPATPNVHYQSVAFVPQSDVAFAAGTNGVIRKSHDGGASWSSIVPPPSTFETLYGVSFAAGGIGYAVGASQTALFTANGGVTWSPVDVQGGLSSEALLSVATWGDGSQAVAVGSHGSVYAKVGTRFHRQDLGALAVAKPLTDVQVLVSGGVEHVRICGVGGVVLFRDGGVWSSPKSQTSEILTAISFVAPHVGYAVGRPFVVTKYE